VTISLPEPPRASPRAPFPIIAVIAPLVAAVVIGAIIRSPYVLVFAALSPIIAVASAFESRRGARRQAREEAARFAAECAATERRTALAHERETESAFASGREARGTIIGAAPGASSVAGEAPSVEALADESVRERLLSLHARAARNERLPVVVPPGPVEVRGSGVVADRVRALFTEHDERGDARADERPTVVSVYGLSGLDITFPDGQRVRADAVLRFAADEERQRARHSAALLPERCDWSSVHSAASEPGLAVGVGTGGPVMLDLIADGPHVLVGGATGSGKSEFLRALALSAAADNGAWSVLYVDFKGGATFHDLAELPSTVGVITDLDAALATRALTSLQAEIERRERVLARERVRDIAHLDAGISRLLVVVDEYAAMVAAHPALQAVFSDLSARGRSLGVHLVLCTQRPSGVVHDTVAVNCAIRVLFRTSDASDARALLGPDAPSVASAPRGRAVVRTSEHLVALQVSLVAPNDIDRVAAEAAHHPPTDPPWAPALPSALAPIDPAVIVARTESAAEGGLLLGLVDDVAAQRWGAAVWNPRRDGALAILGCPGSGRTAALAQISAEARATGWRVIVLPSRLPDAQQVLAELSDGYASAEPRRLLVIDDLAELLESEGPERSATLLGALDTAMRSLHHDGGAVAAVVGTATAAGRLVTGRFGARLSLRALDIDDHHASGAPRGEHNDRAPAGRGWWRGRLVQVIATPATLPSPVHPAVRSIAEEPLLAIVAANPDTALHALHATHRPPVRVVPLGEFVEEASRHDASAGALVCAAHPDDWQRDWAALTHARRSALTVFHGCDTSDLRALVSARVQPPPIEPRELWVIEPGQGSTPEVQRARWAPTSTDPNAPPAA